MLIHKNCHRQNSKLREKSKKDEARRLREFVESAYKIDPRVSMKKDAQKQARLVSSTSVVLLEAVLLLP